MMSIFTDIFGIITFEGGIRYVYITVGADHDTIMIIRR